MRFARYIAVAALFAVAVPAQAADDTLLIQMEEGGRLKVWHTEGETQLPDEQILALEASARPEGGESMESAAGPARAFETKHGIVISIPGARADRALLIDRDACGGVKVWHAEGTTVLSEDDLTELVLSALPGGGPNVRVGARRAKAYTMALGIMAVIWTPVVRRP